MSTKLWAGASGYSFKEWKGPFYPAKLKSEEMLAYYSARLPTVEINATFYRMPQAAMLQAWARNTPAGFRFAFKANKRITHIDRLAADRCAESVKYFYGLVDALGDKRGPVLFQTPPFLKKDLPRLREFLALLPADHRATFEFRHDSWLDDDTYALLKEQSAALCLSEREDAAPPPMVVTAPWGYARLRLETYDEARLAAWAEKLTGAGWTDAHAYFMHEPTAPAYAATLLRLAGQPAPPP